jgi:hypothetical protein
MLMHTRARDLVLDVDMLTLKKFSALLEASSAQPSSRGLLLRKYKEEMSSDCRLEVKTSGRGSQTDTENNYRLLFNERLH